ncbi:hypothetical protein SAMN05660199_04141 [Klenkia soli]|uniref:Excreted virulence factor EspC, type VII ESX diderm n=1 Tax=Klenkia soli TaxID=1052260 RepID=A0A1H0TFS6_9ACTN|nr:hypothetical protein [Klenkia soli]SDP52695.1 hypothetical protein SAMN05660199_04141 [Klenkia soli]
MAEGTDVTLDSVREFATAMGTEGLEVLSDASAHIGPISAASVGLSGVTGAGSAQAHYAQLAQSLTMFLVDTGNNAQALRNVATLVAWNYQHGDTSQQAQMNSVNSALNPAPGTETILSEQAAQQAAAAAEQRRLAILARRTGEDLTPAGTPYVTASGVTLTGPQADAARAAAAANAQNQPATGAGPAGLTTAQRMALVRSTIENHQEEVRQASATRQVTGYDDYGNPVYGYVAPDSYQQSSGAGEENTSTAAEYEEAQEWAAQERDDGYHATVTVGQDGEVHRETDRPPAAYNDYTSSTGTTYTPYSSPSVGG